MSMLTLIQDRNGANDEDAETPVEDESPSGNLTKEYDNEQLHDFFSGLMNRTAGSTDSPRQ